MKYVTFLLRNIYLRQVTFLLAISTYGRQFLFQEKNPHQICYAIFCVCFPCMHAVGALLIGRNSLKEVKISFMSQINVQKVFLFVIG